jgi:DNA-binding LytR/AlgR family response regulator
MDREICVAICDDEPAQLDILERCILGCAYWRGRKIVIERFQYGEELIQRIKSGISYSRVFLDIHMPDMDGIALCGEIHKVSEQPIIFVSAYMEYQPEIDGLYPAMLLSKPYTSENLNNLLTAYSARIEAMKPFVYNAGYESRTIPLKDIVYISAKEQGIRMHLVKNREVDLYGIYLTKVASDYTKQGLFKCHKSHIINLRYYLLNTYKEVHLRSGDKIVKLPLSRELAAGDTLRKVYLNFSSGGFYV